MMYKLEEKGVLRLDDGAHIPDNLGNRDWREYQRWLIDGGVPEPANLKPTPPSVADQAETRMTDDPFARAWVKRQAIKEGKTPRQIMNEIRAEV